MFDDGTASARRYGNCVADGKRAARQAPEICAPRRLGRATDIPDRQPHFIRRQGGGGLAGSRQSGKQIEKRFPRIPGHALGCGDHVIAGEGGDRHDVEVCRIERRRPALNAAGQVGKAVAVKPDTVHLVDGDDDMADAQQQREGQVPPGLRCRAAFRID